MSAAKRNVKATEPMPSYDGPGCNRTHATESALRASQAVGWVGQYVAFDHYANGDCARVVGLCVACESIPRMEPDDIPDFSVSVQSLRDTDRETRVNLVANRCQFYATLQAARRDGLLLRAGKEGA